MRQAGDRRRHHTVISLPQSLLEQISGASVQSSHRNGGRNSHLSRKDARKQERLHRKKKRADYFLHSAHSAKRKVEEEHVDLPQRKCMKISQEGVSHISASTKLHYVTSTKALSHQRTEEPYTTESLPEQKPKTTALERLAMNKLAAKSHKNAYKGSLTRQEKEEDAYIAYLESKLGYTGGGARRKDDDMDGLGDLFDFTENIMTSIPDSVSEYLGDEMGDEDQPTSVEAESDHCWEHEEWGGFDEFSRNGSSAGQNSSADDNNHKVTEVKQSEPSEAQPKAPGRYIPPGSRKQSSVDIDIESEEQLKLTRQLKGLMNRMSEQNIAIILDSIEDVYRNHRRHDVTSTLTNLIIDSISSHSALLDSYVVLYAAFISGLHKLVGIAFAAYFVQNVVASYERHLASLKSTSILTEVTEELGKECSNLVVLFSELYNFQVISCILVYDIIRGFFENDLSEFMVELLLKILRSSGQQLRQDDPMALKDVVNLAQVRVAGQAGTVSSRTRFMIETLNSLANNKIKKTGGTQHQGSDAVERMKKFLSGLGKKKQVLTHEPLRVTLQDLHLAESKGKWWLVGAAWGGDPLVDQQRETLQHGENAGTNVVSNVALVRLAKKQGMNTDIRRSIFVVLMSSDDYLDACERLSQLGLTEVQQREIIKVNLHCCGNEKSYNPFYALICQHLSHRSHSYKITMQFCLWDFLRDLGETSVGGVEVIKNLQDSDVGRFDVKFMLPSRMKNIAKAYAWWIAKDCCTLMILKPVDFTLLKPQTRTFLKELFIQLFVASQVSSPMLSNDLNDYPSTRNRGALEEIFLKATGSENLGLELVFFMSNAFEGDDGFLKWASVLAKETLQRGTDHIPKL